MTSVAAAIERGILFLERSQRRDGSFRDFNLAPGVSTGWITAHVAFVVEAVPEAEQLRRRAACYLESRGALNGGWGYNERVGIDCDSTAQALLVLAACGRDVPQFIVDWLRRCQLPNGAFPTYPSPAAGGWSAGHGDVTLVAMEALRRLGCDEAAARAHDWLKSVVRDGVVPPYWWSDDAYSLWAQARARFDEPVTRVVAASRLAEKSTTQLSMLLSAAAPAITGDEAMAAVSRLLAAQSSDGSWPCDPCLRVTDPRVYSASPDAAGGVHAGRRRVFSTAHATAALAAASNLP